jgi:hypothetical protein
VALREVTVVQSSPTSLYGVSLLEDGSRIDKTASLKVGVNILQELTQLEEHLLDGGVVVGGAGIGSNLCTMVARIAVANCIFIRNSAYDDRFCLLNKLCCIGSAVDVPLR